MGSETGSTMNDATRSLKKYEAEPLVVKRVSGPDEASPEALELYSPFGPFIAKTQLSRTVIDRLNQFADANLGAGGAGAEFLVPPQVVEDGGDQSLFNQLARRIIQYVEAADSSVVESLEFEAVWVVSQPQGCPSPVHFHSADVSGVLYLKTPVVEPHQEQRNYISGRQAGYLNVLSGGKQALNKSLISFKPVVGDLYLFPGWLLHGVEPFAGEGERRSLAFNVNLTVKR